MPKICHNITRFGVGIPIIAGAGMGAIFAFAANKVIERRLERVDISLCTDYHGRNGIKIGYTF